jgi:transcriptional regulator with XRE-family HTH domain
VTLPADVVFAERLRAVRRTARITHRQLADRMTAAGRKMHPSTIAKIEACDRPVSIGEAVHLAAVLCVDLHDLLASSSALPVPSPSAAAWAYAEELKRALIHWVRDYRPPEAPEVPR